MAALQWNSTSCCILIASYLGNGTSWQSAWILAMTPVSRVVLSSKLRVRSQKPILAFYLLNIRSATVLGQRCLEGQIFRCLWVTGHRELHKHYLHLRTVPVHVPWNCWLPAHSWKDTLYLPPFSSILSISLHDISCMHVSFKCGYFAVSLAEVSQSEKHLPPHARQVPDLTGCSATRTAARQHLVLFLAFWIGDLSGLQVKFSCLGFSKLFLAWRPGQCPCACRHWGDFLSDAVTSFPRRWMELCPWVYSTKKGSADLRQIWVIN